jgi:hypothetical protein
MNARFKQIKRRCIRAVAAEKLQQQEVDEETETVDKNAATADSTRQSSNTGCEWNAFVQPSPGSREWLSQR